MKKTFLKARNTTIYISKICTPFIFCELTCSKNSLDYENDLDCVDYMHCGYVYILHLI